MILNVIAANTEHLSGPKKFNTGTVEKQAPEENQTGKFFLDLPVVYIHLSHTDPGLSLRAGGRGFPPATMNVVPGYFHWKIEENRTKRNP